MNVLSVEYLVFEFIVIDCPFGLKTATTTMMLAVTVHIDSVHELGGKFKVESADWRR